MTFFPLPDEFYADPSLAPASDAAIVLWARAASWSAHHLTDGAVPAATLLLLHRDAETAAAELVQLRVWKRTRGGFQYVVWPRLASRAYVEAKRESDRTRQQRRRTSPAQPSRRDTRVTHGVNRDVSHAVSHSTQSSPIQSKSGYVGGESPVGSGTGDERPPTRCPEHWHHTTDPGPCRACGDARRAAEQWDTEQARRAAEARSTAARQRAEDRARAIAACSMCDESGYVGRVLCDHDPTAAERAARGRAATRAVLNGRTP